jgi:hypothetical protein
LAAMFETKPTSMARLVMRLALDGVVMETQSGRNRARRYCLNPGVSLNAAV